MATEYTLAFLQAVNDWQTTGFGEAKAEIAARLVQHSKDLPDKFKRLTTPCYRKLKLKEGSLMELGVTYRLPERYSSWTVKEDVAETFDGGVPPNGWQGVIFKIEPNQGSIEVVLNLNELFKDESFLAACEKYKSQISSYNSGIGYFKGKEAEVILNISEIPIENVWAYGGFSSNREQLAEKLFKRKPSEQDLERFDKMMEEINRKPGDFWQKGASKDRIMQFHIENAQRIFKRDNPNS